MVNKILFELDSRLAFNKLNEAYESIYDRIDEENQDGILPKGINSTDVMIMKKVLEKVRHKTKSINKHLLTLENTLLEKAAEMGNKDAVSLLAFDVLRDPSHNTTEDVAYAKLLIKDLYKRKHHLTLKLTGDLAFKSDNLDEAKKYYKLFLEVESDSFLSGEVYGQLGQIYFRTTKLSEAESSFLKSLQFSPLEYSVRSYFYLSQMYMSSDPVKARTLMESCATQGFKESFKALGYLEMNYFRDLYKAQEWFKLGMELFELECFIGYFDCCALLKDWGLANKCYISMQRMAELNKNYKPLILEFSEARHDKIKKAAEYTTQSFVDGKLIDSAKRTKRSFSKDNTWGL